MTDTWNIAQAPAKMVLAAHMLRLAGYEVWIPTEAFRDWVKNRRVLKDRRMLYDYLFYRGGDPWAAGHVDGVQRVVLDADLNPAEVKDSDLERFRVKPGEKPKVSSAWRFPVGKRVHVDYPTYSGRAEIADTSHTDRRKGLLWVNPLGPSIGSVQVPVSALEPAE